MFIKLSRYLFIKCITSVVFHDLIAYCCKVFITNRDVRNKDPTIYFKFMIFSLLMTNTVTTLKPFSVIILLKYGNNQCCQHS